MAIYFALAATGHIKIGYAGCVHERIKTLSAGLPGLVTLLGHGEGGIKVETRLHHAHAADHYVLEWFHDTTAVRASLKALRAGRILEHLQTIEAAPSLNLRRPRPRSKVAFRGWRQKLIPPQVDRTSDYLDAMGRRIEVAEILGISVNVIQQWRQLRRILPKNIPAVLEYCSGKPGFDAARFLEMAEAEAAEAERARYSRVPKSPILKAA